MSVPPFELNGEPIKITPSFDQSQIKNKSVIITGGGSGLGKAYAKAFSAAGGFVTIGDVDEKSGLDVVAEISADGRGGAQFVKCDVRNWEEQVTLFEQATKNSPENSCDIVIANAGIGSLSDQLLRKQDPSLAPVKPDLSIVDINLYGVLYTAKLANHYFRRQEISPSRDRCLILISSTAGYLDFPGGPLYQVSKFGVRAIMRSLRWTSWQESIRVNVVAPWLIKTPMLTERTMVHLESKGTPFASEEDAVKAILRIASDRSMNGRSLAVIPRSWVTEGYLDIDQDSFKNGDRLEDWQKQVLYDVQPISASVSAPRPLVGKF